MHKILTSFFLLFSFCFFAQTDAKDGIYDYTDGTISIKWFPSDFDQFHQMIRNTTKVYRFELTEGFNKNELIISDATLIKTIPPSIDLLNEKIKDSTYANKAGLVTEPFLSKSKPKSEQDKNLAFSLAMIEALISSSFQFDIGIALTDTPKKDMKFIYLIKNESGASWMIEANTISPSEYPAIQFDLSLDKRKTVDIDWYSSNYEGEYFGYIIEKSVGDSTSKTLLTKKPYLPFKNQFEKTDKTDKVRDDSTVEGSLHFYRIQGIDLFGRVQTASPWKMIYVPHNINAYIQIDTAYSTENSREIKVNVVSSQKQRTSSDITLTLTKSKERDGRYSVVEQLKLTETSHQFSIPASSTGDAYYYKAVLTNTDGDAVSSLPYYLFTFDAEPPSPPTSIEGKIDSLGIISLTWTASQDKDIKGYRVFRGNSLSDEFVERTQELVYNEIFKDTVTLNTLTSTVFFYLQAVDNNYNNSVASDTILILKPDTIPPIPCLLESITMEDKGLKIKWINSPSPDIKLNYLLRKSEQFMDTLLLIENNNFQNWTDTTVIPGKGYSYHIITYDQSNNFSFSKELYQQFEPGYRNPLSGLSGEADRINKNILLKWDVINENVFSIQIYRSIGDSNQSTLYKTIAKKNLTTFMDTNLSINNSYTYTLKYITKRGIHSKPSSVKIVY